MTALDYEKDPGEIYRQSFATIRSEVDLDRFPNGMRELAIRLIHSCGMTGIVDELAFSENAFETGRAAISNGAPILCDVQMVRHGIIRKLLTVSNDVHCMIKDEAVKPIAIEQETTLSAAQVELWKPFIDGSVVVIGNAPTALFRLLEVLDEIDEKPAVILGFPVGFVGAMESKGELIANPRGVPFITIKGRLGGSAMAAAAVNALSGGLQSYG